ncbi:MAG: hypothetical protein ABR555_09650 [Pyrinomonadaceae bacterium]
MKNRKLFLILLFVVAMSQIPFAYRRYKLGRLSAVVDRVNAERKAINAKGPYIEYKGVAHVHSFLGGHSVGSFSEIIAAAQSNQLQFVIMTEHVEKDFDTADMTLRGVHGGVLFLNGNEVSTAGGNRLLIIPGDGSLVTADKSASSEIAAKAKTEGALSVVAYPEEWKNWQKDRATDYSAIEIYNVFTNARRVNPFVAFFDVLWSHRRYPDLLFATLYERPAENLKKWDQLLENHRLTATAGNDAHANVGFSLRDRTGKTLAGIDLDPYHTSFHIVRLHTLVPAEKRFDAGSLINALKAGHCFIGFDIFGDTSGFSFSGDNKIQGDEIELQPHTTLKVEVPVSSHVILFKDGAVFADESAVTFKEFPVSARGVYRVEVYLPQLGGRLANQPWIISNPIWVR